VSYAQFVDELSRTRHDSWRMSIAFVSDEPPPPVLTAPADHARMRQAIEERLLLAYIAAASAWSALG